MLLAHISLVIVFVFVFSHRKVLVNISKQRSAPTFAQPEVDTKYLGAQTGRDGAGENFYVAG